MWEARIVAMRYIPSRADVMNVFDYHGPFVFVFLDVQVIAVNVDQSIMVRAMSFQPNFSIRYLWSLGSGLRDGYDVLFCL